jgi:16S rRNA (adenine1518-N6/adenine1519-N6)-dimethyltransferase
MPPPGSPADHPKKALAALGLSPRKSFGQNFLHDGNIARKIVDLARSFPAPYLEIGPGLGALTRPLAETGSRVVAVEVDRGLAAHLRREFEGSAVEVLEADFLAVPGADWRARFPSGGTVVGNLPYSISSPVILRLIALRELFPRAVLMLQKEMVERLCAAPGGKEYGILSVYLSVLAETRREFAVKRSCFHPAPDVDSAVITVRFSARSPTPCWRRCRPRSARASRTAERRCATPPCRSFPGGRGSGAGCSRRKGSTRRAGGGGAAGGLARARPEAPAAARRGRALRRARRLPRGRSSFLFIGIWEGKR